MYVRLCEWIGTKADIEPTLIRMVHADGHPFPSEILEEVFVKNEGYALAMREELESAIHNPEFVEQMKDVIEYWMMDYLRDCVKIHTIDKEQHEKLFLHQL